MSQFLLYSKVNTGAAVAPAYWFFGPVTENGISGGSPDYYIRATTAAGLTSAVPIPNPVEGDEAVTRFSTANGAIFMHRAVLGSVSFDYGETWSACNIALNPAYDVYWDGSYYFSGGDRSADGITWAPMPSTPGSGARVAFARSNDGLLLSFLSGTLYESFDSAASWQVAWVPGVNIGPSFVSNGTRIFYLARTSALQYTDDIFSTTAEFGLGDVVRFYISPNEVVYRSLDSDIGRFEFDTTGMTEVYNGASLGGSTDATIAYANGVWAAVDKIVDSTADSIQVVYSEDGGTTWSAAPGLVYSPGAMSLAAVTTV